MVSFVHEARKHGLEPEVVPGIEADDGPLEEAMAANDAALFVVLRSDNLTGERTLSLKRAFNTAKKPAQHLLALRLEPARAATAVRTIARRLQQLMAPRPSPTPAPARKPAAKPAPTVQPEVDEWAGTLIHEKNLPVDRTPSPVPATAKPSTPPPTPVSKPPASSKPPEHTWSGTLIADEHDHAQLTDLDATPVPTSESMPSAPPATPRAAKQAEPQWGGTLIADPESDFDLTLQDIPCDDESPSDSARPSPLLTRPARRSRLGLVAGLAGVVVLGGLGTVFALQGKTSDDPPAADAKADAAVGDASVVERENAPVHTPDGRAQTTKKQLAPNEPVDKAVAPPVASRKQAPPAASASSGPEPSAAGRGADLPSLADDDPHEPTEREEPEPEPESEPSKEVAAAPALAPDLVDAP